MTKNDFATFNIGEIKMELKIFLKDYGILLTTGATFFATLVALFKDWIYGKIYQPKICILPEPESSFVAHFTDGDTDDKHKEIDSYIYRIKIRNAGNGVCKNMQIYLENISFKSESDANYHEIEITSSDFIKSNSKEEYLQLTQYGRPVSFDLIKILSPKNENSNANGRGTEKARIKIGNTQLPIEETGGKYKISFSIFSENTKSKIILFSLDWKGTWDNDEKNFLQRSVKIVMEKK